MQVSMNNLVKIFAKEIHEGNWDRNSVPDAILEDVEEELFSLEAIEEEEEDNGAAE